MKFSLLRSINHWNLFAGKKVIKNKSVKDSLHCSKSSTESISNNIASHVSENLNQTEFTIIHRFKNGMYLTCTPFRKQYRSSDHFTYNINYNVYSLYNSADKTSTVVNIIQSDTVTDNTITESSILVRKIGVFMDKPLYVFKDFIFSEIIDNNFIITGNHFSISKDFNKGNNSTAVLNKYKSKKVWNLTNINDTLIFKGQTCVSEENAILTCRIFKEIEYTLYTLVSHPETKANNKTASKYRKRTNKSSEYLLVNKTDNKETQQWHSGATGAVTFTK